MTANDLSDSGLGEARPRDPLTPQADAMAAPAPELGDVIDSIDDAAATLKTVAQNGFDRVLEDARTLIRDQPLVAVALAAAVAYVVGRMGR